MAAKAVAKKAAATTRKAVEKVAQLEDKKAGACRAHSASFFLWLLSAMLMAAATLQKKTAHARIA